MPLRVEWSGSWLYKFIHSLSTARPHPDMISTFRSRAPSRLTLFPPLRPPLTDRRATTSTGLTLHARFSRTPLTVPSNLYFLSFSLECDPSAISLRFNPAKSAYVSIFSHESSLSPHISYTSKVLS